jgi:superoxide dismutase
MNGGGKPSGIIGDAINKSFGSYDEFANQFKTAGATQFGSGWAWLVTDKAGKLSVAKTPNAETPLVTDHQVCFAKSSEHVSVCSISNTFCCCSDEQWCVHACTLLEKQLDSCGHVKKRACQMVTRNHCGMIASPSSFT